jgi:UTP--glucose-1-phosphate uridylyltransferase
MKAIIPAAGQGTRLLTVTKEQPKEMLPVFAKSLHEGLCLKPLLQLVFEQLYDVGIREFCFIVGRGKRAIEDHFTPDKVYVDSLNNKNKVKQALDLKSFYDKLENSNIIWLNQPEPKGFGHAVLQARLIVGNERFLVHAGDTYIISKKNQIIKQLIKLNKEHKTEATLILQEIINPKQYGIIEYSKKEKWGYWIKKAIEKPDKPSTNLAIMPIYIFSPEIFNSLEKIQIGKGGEYQLTDGIQRMIELNNPVNALELKKNEIRLDIGTPENYYEAQNQSYKYYSSIGPL